MWGIDFENLLKYVKKKASNAKVIVIGDFWSKGNRDDQNATCNDCTECYIC